MTKAFGIIAILVGLYIGMTIYGASMDRTVNGIFRAIERPEDSGTPRAAGLTPAAGLVDEPQGTVRPRVRVTEAVRQRVAGDLQASAERRYGRE